MTLQKKLPKPSSKRELESDLGSDGIDGITDVVEKIEALLPDWLDAVMGKKSVAAQIRAVWSQYLEQENKLERRKAQPSALLSTKIRMAREMLPLAERSRGQSQTYLVRSVELDPLVSALARLIAEHPDSSPMATPVREAVDEAMEEIQKADVMNVQDTIQAALRKMAHLGRIFQQCNATFDARRRNAKEANEIVRRWAAELIDRRFQSKRVSLDIANAPEDTHADNFEGNTDTGVT